MSTLAAAERIRGLPLRIVAEIGFTLLVIYLLSGGPIQLGRSYDPRSSYEGNPRLQALLVILYFLSLALAVRHPKAWWKAIRADLALTTLLGWTLASAIWSEAPDVTLVRALALLGTSFFGVYLAVRYPPENQLRLLGIGLGLVVLYNAYLVLSHPGVIGAADFAGGFDHKNTLGKIMSLATLTFLCIARERRARGLAILGGLVSFAVLVISGSASGLVVTMTLVGVFPLLRMLKGDIRLVATLAIVGVLVLGIGVLLGPQLLAVVVPALGRDTTLTGRTELWPVLIQRVRDRPWLGYGYSAFWSGDDALGISWQPTQAHNGYLEVALGLGLIGLALFGVLCLRGVARAFRYFRREGTPFSPWPLMYLGYVLLYNITEGTTLSRNSILWVVLVAALITVSPVRDGVGRRLGRVAKQGRPRPHRVLVPTPGDVRGAPHTGIP